MKHAVLPTINKIIGANIKSRRKVVALNQQEFAFKIGRTRATVINLEAGRAATTLESLLRICQVLDCTPNDILPLAHKFELPTLDKYEKIKLKDKIKNLQAKLDEAKKQFNHP